MKTYLKDLTPEEVIRRLKAGEVVENEKCKIKYKIIEGVLCGLWTDGGIDYNARIISDKEKGWYFETPDELKLEVGKCYKTRDGRMAFVNFKDNKISSGVIVGSLDVFSWKEDGTYLHTAIDSNYDLISEWSDYDVAED